MDEHVAHVRRIKPTYGSSPIGDQLPPANLSFMHIFKLRIFETAQLYFMH